jgi:hypothetical protein
LPAFHSASGTVAVALAWLRALVPSNALKKKDLFRPS